MNNYTTEIITKGKAAAVDAAVPFGWEEGAGRTVVTGEAMEIAVKKGEELIVVLSISNDGRITLQGGMGICFNSFLPSVITLHPTKNWKIT